MLGKAAQLLVSWTAAICSAEASRDEDGSISPTVAPLDAWRQADRFQYRCRSPLPIEYNEKFFEQTGWARILEHSRQQISCDQEVLQQIYMPTDLLGFHVQAWTIYARRAPAAFDPLLLLVDDFRRSIRHRGTHSRMAPRWILLASLVHDNSSNLFEAVVDPRHGVPCPLISRAPPWLEPRRQHSACSPLHIQRQAKR